MKIHSMNNVLKNLQKKWLTAASQNLFITQHLWQITRTGQDLCHPARHSRSTNGVYKLIRCVPKRDMPPSAAVEEIQLPTYCHCALHELFIRRPSAKSVRFLKLGRHFWSSVNFGAANWNCPKSPSSLELTSRSFPQSLKMKDNVFW